MFNLLRAIQFLMMLRAGVDAPAGPLWLCLIVALASGIAGVDRGNFKTCDQSFCKYVDFLICL